MGWCAKPSWTSRRPKGHERRAFALAMKRAPWAVLGQSPAALRRVFHGAGVRANRRSLPFQILHGWTTLSFAPPAWPRRHDHARHPAITDGNPCPGRFGILYP